ncbi:hypothetical protein LCGC14_2296160, partial [marine sediment metagenome]
CLAPLLALGDDGFVVVCHAYVTPPGTPKVPAMWLLYPTVAVPGVPLSS